LGQLTAQVLQAAGYHLHVLIRHQKQRELLNMRNIPAHTEQDLAGQKFDVVIEVTGSPEGFSIAKQCVRSRGKIVLKSTYRGDHQVNFSSLVVDEVTLIGSRCGPFEPVLKLLADGTVDPLPLVDASYPLDQGIQAFDRAAQSGVFKILIKP
jgi:threonine dehydrogenase-like Zn-dependent dehydrogenase